MYFNVFRYKNSKRDYLGFNWSWHDISVQFLYYIQWYTTVTYSHSNIIFAIVRRNPEEKFFLLLPLKNSAWARLPGICIFNFCENFYQRVQIFTMFHVFRLQSCITTISSGSSRAPRQWPPVSISVHTNESRNLFQRRIFILDCIPNVKSVLERPIWRKIRKLQISLFFFLPIFSSRFHESILLFFFFFSFFWVFRHIAM